VSLDEQERTAVPSGTPEFTSVFSGVRVARTLVFCVALSTIMHLFVLFQLAVVLSVGLRLLIAHFVFVILSIGRGTISSNPICIQLIENVIDLVNNSIVFLVITTSVQHHGDIRMNTTVDRLYKYTVKIHIILLFPNSCLITGIVTRLTRRMPVVEKELLTLPEHLSSPPVFNGVHVTRSLVLCVCFVDLFVLLSFFFWPLCYICSSIYGFWLPPFGIFKLFLVIKWKIKTATLSNPFQNQISKSSKEAKRIPLTHKYRTAHLPGLVQAFHYKLAGLN
jgi:hypothetical protein